jgi:hypothetical protein
VGQLTKLSFFFSIFFSPVSLSLSLSPCHGGQLCSMSVEDMATDEQKAWRQEQQRELLLDQVTLIPSPPSPLHPHPFTLHLSPSPLHLHPITPSPSPSPSPGSCWRCVVGRVRWQKFGGHQKDRCAETRECGTTATRSIHRNTRLYYAPFSIAITIEYPRTKVPLWQSIHSSHVCNVRVFCVLCV